MSSGGFKPFLADEAKQSRYEKFLAANLKDDAEITTFLADLQPVTLSLWDREMEKKEFIQAAKIYRPLAGLMFDRFVSEATVQAEQEQKKAEPTEKTKPIMERTKCMWKPSALLCKRYNIAEPFGGALPEPEKELKAKAKISVFDYLETSINTKSNFQTPSIIPKHIELPKQQTQPVPVPPAKEKKEEEKPQATASTAAVESIPLPKPSFVPTTPLEQAVDEARDKPISEKTDLFKSIFDDSDEETEENSAAADKPSQEQEADKLLAMQEALGLPSSSKSAAAANVLRNTSPPRGIFAALFKAPTEESTAAAAAPQPPKFAPIEGNKLKISYKSREERLKNDKEEAMAQVPSDQLYGPKLPDVQAKQKPSEEASIDAKLQQLWQQHAPPSKRKAENWVEKRLDSSTEDSADSSDSSDNSDSSGPKAKKTKTKKSHKSGSSKKSKKSKQKSKKKSKKSEKSKHKGKKKKSKH